MTGRRLTAGIVSVAYSLGFSPSAQAETLFDTRAISRDCAESLLARDAAGADRRSWTAPSRGFVAARLRGGRRGDWDLAAFRRGGAVGASTAFGSEERVDLWVERGERLVFQGCRRRGGSPQVPLAISLYRTAPPAASEPVSLVEVPIAGPEDLAELEALGLDVTHDVDADSATLALYSRDERLLIQREGFGVNTMIADLAAADAADRQAERSVARRGVPSGLPSGRTGYRQYVDFTDEMKDLATNNPDIVRELVIGNTFEGRPIQGIEIAGDVNAEDDGRPVYVNMGTHHAREWPSGELPMEFAIDLVNGYGADTRITNLLDRVRVIVVPIVNVDGFLASRSYGTTPADDDSNATLTLSLSDQAAYKRKNCRPTVPGQADIPCAMRTNSGVDLNRNYGAYWGGPGSSTDVRSQSYRGVAPYSEPESQAVHTLSQGIHPTVFITNHTFTQDGKWLRQPGFDAPFLPQDSIGATSPDEAAMKDLGDEMEAATGWTSERGYETLGDITGATEDWNYFAQGSYGYTPEARGSNFHANYQDSVIEEYVGDAQHPGEGVREAYLIAGERAADRSEHSVIEGSAPDAATLRLRKDFQVPLHPQQGPNASFADELETTLDVPDGGSYEWDVMPSGRPLQQGETWTMSCELPGEDPVSRQVFVARGESAAIDWGAGCATGGGTEEVSCRGDVATLVGSLGDDRGETKLRGTSGVDVVQARGGDDVAKADDGKDIVCGGSGNDVLDGGKGKDLLRGGPGNDRCPGAKPDEVRSCRI
ncbi:MAG: M14 family zinc carboxypeptidase [Solirubrobacterales bacterium]